MNSKILVTGGAGYIGAHTIVELYNAGYEPVIVDDFSKSDNTLLDGIEQLLNKKVNFHRCDCKNIAELREIFRVHGPFHCVLHFAAFKSVGESVKEPLWYYENNIGSMLAVLKAMNEFDTKNLIFSSSCTVYGQPEIIPVDENTPFQRAESPYGSTKQMCERILEDVYLTGLNIISLRYFNPIGAHPSALLGEIPIGSPNNLVPYITQTAAGVREKLTVFGDDYNTPDGSCVRDFIHVVDLATAHVMAMQYLTNQSASTFYETFNLGTGVGVSVLELVRSFIEVTGVNLNYTIGPRRAGDVEKVYADPTKAFNVLNWRPKYSVKESLKHAWAWEMKLRNSNQ